MRAILFSIVVSIAGLSACYPPAPPLEPMRSSAEDGGSARVVLDYVSNDMLHFTVWNNTDDWMTVDRDAVLLVTHDSTRPRLEGGYAHHYTLPPHSSHDVHVRFDFSDLVPGQIIQVRFDRALWVGGSLVEIEPIELYVR